jgi:hypothetical protein
MTRRNTNAFSSSAQFPAPGVLTFSFREWHKCQARREGPERCLAQSVFRCLSFKRLALRSAPVRRLFAQGPVLPGTRALHLPDGSRLPGRRGNPPWERIEAPARTEFLRPAQSPSSQEWQRVCHLPADGSYERPDPAVTSRNSGRRSRAACKHVCRHAPRGKGLDEYNPITINCQVLLIRHPEVRAKRASKDERPRNHGWVILRGSWLCRSHLRMTRRGQERKFTRSLSTRDNRSGRGCED